MVSENGVKQENTLRALMYLEIVYIYIYQVVLKDATVIYLQCNEMGRK